jgi:hypothetical protein
MPQGILSQGILSQGILSQGLLLKAEPRIASKSNFDEGDRGFDKGFDKGFDRGFDKDSDRQGLFERSAKSQAPDITIEMCVEPRCEAVCDASRAWEFAGWLIPTGYTLFGAALALSNLTLPSMASTVCVGMSPLAMLCLMAHATIVPFWAGACMMALAWFLPSVCAAWTLPAGVAFSLGLGVLVTVGVTVGASPGRWLVGSGLVGLILSLGFSLTSSLHGVEPRWGVSVACFFLLVMCVLATRQMGRVVYKIKQFVG